MIYHVVVHRLALHDLQSAYQWAAQRAPHTAASWLDRFESSLQSLEHHPSRCGLAREHGKVDVELREFLFGQRPSVFRAIFTIDDDTVRILRIRRAQRRPLTHQDLTEALEPEA